jgi:hypothetical protein
MDPTTTLAELLCALKAKDRDEAEEKLASLLDWIRMGGFLPNVKEAIGR